MKEISDSAKTILEDKGIENGHIMVQLLVGVEDDNSYTEGTSILDMLDGEITYNAAEEG